MQRSRRETAGYLGGRRAWIGLLPLDERIVGLVGGSQLLFKCKCSLLGNLQRLHKQHGSPKHLYFARAHAEVGSKYVSAWLRGIEHLASR